MSTFKDQQCRQWTSKLNIEARSRNHSCLGKAVSITYSQCASVALFIQHAKHMRRIILSAVACLALPYGSSLSYKWYELKITEPEISVLILSTNIVCNISHFKNNYARYCYKHIYVFIYS